MAREISAILNSRCPLIGIWENGFERLMQIKIMLIMYFGLYIPQMSPAILYNLRFPWAFHWNLCSDRNGLKGEGYGPSVIRVDAVGVCHGALLLLLAQLGILL